MNYTKRITFLVLVTLVFGAFSHITFAKQMVTVVATTNPATSITTTSAVVSGSGMITPVSPLHAGEYFEYGTSTSTMTSHVNYVYSGTTRTETLSGLTPNTTYYYRFVVDVGPDFTTNCMERIGGCAGQTLSFTTLSSGGSGITAPVVTTNSASSSSPNTADLYGYVVVNGAPVTRWFEYSTVSGSLNSTVTVSGTQANDGQFTFYVTGLYANTVYYYRACAQNSAGTNCGAENHFSTPSSSNNGGNGGGGYYPNNNTYYPNNTTYQNPTVYSSGTTQCNDGIDNDGDGKIDQYDPGCADSQDNSEGGESTTTNTTNTVYVSDVATSHRASSTTAMYGSAKALVLLALDSTNNTGNQGDIVGYKVSYRNMSGKRLYNAEIAITLPNDLAIDRLPNGGGAIDSQHFTIDLGTVFTGEEKTITFDAKVVSRFQRDNLHRADAKMTYVFSDNTKGEVTAYENDSIDFFTSGNGLGGLALFSGGTGFLPSTFLGWILLVVLLYIIVFLFIRFMNERKPKV